MSLDGEPSNARSGMTGFRKFFASTTCSDIKIELPLEDGVVDAHKIVLAAGSGYLHRKFKKAEDRGENVVKWQVDDDCYPDSARDAIQYMYGLQLPARYGNTKCFHSLGDYAALGQVAEKYDIHGLYDLMFKAANRVMADCLDDHDSLQVLLGMFRTPKDVSSAYFYNSGVRVIRENLTELHRNRAFYGLLRSEPKMAVILLNLLVDEKNGLNTNDISFEEYEEFNDGDPESEMGDGDMDFDECEESVSS